MTDRLATDLCVSAAMASVKDTIGHFDWKPRNKDTASDQTPEAGIEASKVAEPAPRIITKSHFDHGFTEIVPSFSEKANSELLRWHEMFSRSPTIAQRNVRWKAINGATQVNGY
jgi:hypothetical protein